jgi:hypothetical protein
VVKMSRKSNLQKLKECSGWPVMTKKELENSWDNSGMYEYQLTTGHEFGYRMYWSARRGGVWVKE